MTEIKIKYNFKNDDLFVIIYDPKKGAQRFNQAFTLCYSHIGQHSQAAIEYVNESTSWLPDSVIKDAQNLLNEIKSIYGQVKLLNNIDNNLIN
jgi:hypothetical protein